MNRGRSYLTSVGFAAAGLSLIAPALAQEVSGLTATFGISQSIESSDNLNLNQPAQSSTRGVTDLSFGLVSATSHSRLSFNTSGQFEFGSDETGFTDPQASLEYSTLTRNTQLTMQADYSEADVNALTTAFADLDGFGLDEVLVVGDGTRRRTGYSLSFETGRDAPLGFILIQATICLTLATRQIRTFSRLSVSRSERPHGCG
jgi:hypothetical protein